MLIILIVNSGVNAFDLITSSGIKKISNNKHLKFYEPKLNSPENKKIIKNNEKKRATIKSSCLQKNRYGAIISKASQQYQVDEKLIKAIITTESCFNASAVSPKGAKGLMQLMPFTAKRFGVNDRFDPAQNIMGGVKYLRFLLRRFNGKSGLAIAAYNAGEGAVDHYSGIPPYKETQQYVKRVLDLLGRKQVPSTYIKQEIKKKKNRKQKLATKCLSNKKIRSYTYAHYGARSVKRYYLVRINDTLQKISHRVGLDVVAIQKLNRLDEGDLKSSQIRALLLSECSS